MKPLLCSFTGDRGKTCDNPVDRPRVGEFVDDCRKDLGEAGTLSTNKGSEELCVDLGELFVPSYPLTLQDALDQARRRSP